MSLIIAVIFTGIVQLSGLVLIVRFLQRTMDQQTKTIQMLAIFKKSESTSDMAAMVDITDQMGKTEPVKVEIKREDHYLPHEMDDVILSKVREQM